MLLLSLQATVELAGIPDPSSTPTTQIRDRQRRPKSDWWHAAKYHQEFRRPLPGRAILRHFITDSYSAADAVENTLALVCQTDRFRKWDCVVTTLFTAVKMCYGGDPLARRSNDIGE